ncbi:hypothetical protein Pmani_008668 [Petrolisthes manimaculis]|uniref:Peroxidasin n=1 Tax=Petrolisthes manimaculis TaxID=1843537 RepID=A0AAE1Q5W9_9EUCA|nr:hypothetical protein Pmani_008668 [Petrolisthes manimaculis]
MVLLMGVKNEELVQRIISLNAGSTLQEFVNCCRAYEATKMTASVIHAMPSQLKAVSTYKKNQRHEKKAYSQQTYTDNTPLTNASTKNAQMPLLKAARAQGKVAFFRHTKLIIKEKISGGDDGWRQRSTVGVGARWVGGASGADGGAAAVDGATAVGGAAVGGGAAAVGGAGGAAAVGGAAGGAAAVGGGAAAVGGGAAPVSGAAAVGGAAAAAGAAAVGGGTATGGSVAAGDAAASVLLKTNLAGTVGLSEIHSVMPEVKELATCQGASMLEAAKRVFPQARGMLRAPSMMRLPTKVCRNFLPETCSLRVRQACTFASSKYRSLDGSCNNLNQAKRGAAMTNYKRLLPPAYDDAGAKTDTHWQPQQGRDHGLPGYNKWRKKCGLQPFMTFESMSQVMRKGDINVFKRMYKSVEDIDLYPAGLAERGQNSLLGPTFSCIVAQQFHDLRHGDRFWYENNQQLDHPFSTRQLAAIRAVSLASILCEHTTISSLQRNPFLVPNQVTRECRVLVTASWTFRHGKTVLPVPNPMITIQFLILVTLTASFPLFHLV